jgi:hypothetical protein
MTEDERRPLELLEGSADDTTDALLVAHGFPLKVILGTIGVKLATAQPERVFAAGKPVGSPGCGITDAGRLALAERQG